MSYSFPYILLIIFFLSIASIQLGIPFEEKSRRYINYSIIIVYILFFGFRGFIATDWISYYSYFKDLPIDFAIALKKSSFEPGFVVYSVLIKKIFSSYEAFQFINTLTNVCLLHFFFKKYLPGKYYAFGFAVFIVFYGGILEINLLRNFKALFLFLIALPYIEQRKPFKYFTLIFIALLFHWSSIVFIPLYFFLHKKIPIKFFLIIFIVGSIIYLLQIQFITPLIKSTSSLLPSNMSGRILNYLQNSIYAKSYGLTFGYFERTLVAFLILLYYKKITYIKQNILFVNSFLIFISLYLYCSEVTIILERVASNFAYSYWIMIPLIIINIDRNIKPIAFVFFCLLFIAKIHMITNFVFYDYDSFLSGNHKTYEVRYNIIKKNQHIFIKK